MLTARIDVGPATRWSELATVESLDSLLAQQYIPFEWYIELLPKNCRIPKERIAELIKKFTGTAANAAATTNANADAAGTAGAAD